MPWQGWNVRAELWGRQYCAVAVLGPHRRAWQFGIYGGLIALHAEPELSEVRTTVGDSVDQSMFDEFGPSVSVMPVTW